MAKRLQEKQSKPQAGTAPELCRTCEICGEEYYYKRLLKGRCLKCLELAEEKKT